MKKHEIGRGNQGEQASDNGWGELENYAPEQNGSDTNGGWDSKTRDRVKFQLTREADKRQADYEQKRAEVLATMDRIHDLKQPTGEYYSEPGGEVRQYRHDTSDEEKALGRLRKEAARAGEAYSELDTPEKIEAETARLQKESEDFDKYFVKGATPELIEDIKSLDQRIAENKDPEGKARLAAKRKELVDAAIANGKTIEYLQEQKEIQEKDMDNSLALAEKRAKREKRVKPEQMSEHIKDLEARVDHLVEKMGREALKKGGAAERIWVKTAKEGLEYREEKLSELEAERRNLAEKGLSTKEIDKKIKDRKESVDRQEKKLESYGYRQGAHGEDSYVYKQLDVVGSVNDATNGLMRARDYTMLKIALADKNTKKATKKAMKAAGFRKLPDSWNDSSITAHQMNEIVFAAGLA